MEKNNKDIVKIIATNAVVAALYVAITFAIAPIAYGALQVRLSEALVLLCFFNRRYTYGLTLGCLIANLFSTMLPWDLIFGTLATLLSCLVISFCRHLAIACLAPIVFNGFIVGAELYFILEEPFWFSVGFVALGELIAVGVLGYALFMLIGKRPFVQQTLGFNRNLEFKW